MSDSTCSPPYPEASRRSAIAFSGAGANVAAAARGWTRCKAAEWGLAAPVRDNLVLIASELVTNAVMHTHSREGLVMLALAQEPGEGVRIEVRDQGCDGGSGPVAAAADPADVLLSDHGRGMLLVTAYSRAWGSDPVQAGHPEAGHVVWAYPLGREPRRRPSCVPAGTGPGRRPRPGVR